MCIEFVWFNCQGVQTLSFDESIDGVPQPLSIKQSVPSRLSFGSPPPVSTRGAEDSEPAPTVPGSASPEGTYFAPPQEAVSSSLIDDLWHRALENYGLQRPTDVTENSCLPGDPPVFLGQECVYSDGYQNGSYG